MERNAKGGQITTYSYTEKVAVIAGMIRTLAAKGGDDQRLPILREIHHDLLRNLMLRDAGNEMVELWNAKNPQPQEAAP